MAAVLMDRSLSSDVHGGGRHRYYHNDQQPQPPPWEQRQLPQVPYMPPQSPPLTRAEREALPMVWASHQGNRPNADSTAQDWRQPGSKRSLSSTASVTAWQEQTDFHTPPRSAPPRYVPARKPASEQPATPKPRRPDAPPLSRPPRPATPIDTSTTNDAERDDAASKKSKSASLKIGRRFKLALKDVFKRDPVDETEFERIETHHWTDE